MRHFLLFLFTLISLSLLPVVYLVSGGYDVCSSMLQIESSNWTFGISCIIYFGVTVLTTWLFSFTIRLFEKRDLKEENIIEIESADSFLIPTYLAYIFIGLSLNGIYEFVFCYALIVFICFLAQTYIFNPIFYFLGYKFYFITNSRKRKLLVMTRRRIALNQEIEFNKLYKLNDYTFIDF